MRRSTLIAAATIAVSLAIFFSEYSSAKPVKSKKKYTLLYEDSAGRHYMDTQTFEEVTKARRKKKEAFYDGEGNPIPERIVRLYVQAHFVQMEPQEVDSIRKYFYFY